MPDEKHDEHEDHKEEGTGHPQVNTDAGPPPTGDGDGPGSGQ